MSYFVFVEPTNKRANDLLSDLRRAFVNQDKEKPNHITIRGPYKDPPKAKELETWKGILKGHGISINGHGYFANKGFYSVFIRAECSAFNDVWDKPDFQSKTKPIQPHITLYETTDLDAARKVDDFLKKQNIKIYTHDFDLRVYAAKQEEMFIDALPKLSTTSDRPIRRRTRLSVPYADDVVVKARTLGYSIAFAKQKKLVKSSVQSIDRLELDLAKNLELV